MVTIKKSVAQKNVVIKKDVNSLEKRRRVNARGFASMSHDKVVEIAKKGGLARAEQLGHDGYVELGHKSGEARSGQLGRNGYVKMDRKSRKSSVT
jgi:general stress protein YciG